MVDMHRHQRAKRGSLKLFVYDVAAVYEGDDCLIWPYAKNNKGYGQVRIDGKRVLVHRIVCELVNGYPPSINCEAAHLCGNGHLGCCNARHLTWKTHKENCGDRAIHGTQKYGETCSYSLLNDYKVTEILKLKGVERVTSLAKRFGVSHSTICKIHSRGTWKHIPMPDQSPRDHGSMFNEFDALKIYSMKETTTVSDASKMTGVSRSTIHRIWNKQTWANIHLHQT